MKARVGEGPNFILTGANDVVRQAGNVIDKAVADIWYVIFMAGQLPDPFPKPFNLEIKKVSRIIDAWIDDRWTGLDRRIFPQLRRDIMCVHVQ